MVIAEETISYTISQEQLCNNDFQNIMAHQWLIANSACSTKSATEKRLIIVFTKCHITV